MTALNRAEAFLDFANVILGAKWIVGMTLYERHASRMPNFSVRGKYPLIVSGLSLRRLDLRPYPVLTQSSHLLFTPFPFSARLSLKMVRLPGLRVSRHPQLKSTDADATEGPERAGALTRVNR